MRAVVYHGSGRRAWEEVPDPEITDDGDVIVRVDTTTICGTDLHILKGDVPAVRQGRILGHEAVGTVWDAGEGVHTLTPGDRVLVSCISACGTCRFCREGRYGQCLGGGGWVLGHKIDGTQAEYVRVPFADMSTYRVPDGASDDEILMVASEADLLALHHGKHKNAEGLVAGDLMTHPAVTVRPDDSVEHAALMMYSLLVKRLSVVDAGGFLVGIVSRADLLASFDRPDEEILAEIAHEVIVGRFGMGPALVRVSVTDGVVTLEGRPDAILGDELADAIRHVRGVVAVRDEFGYPPAENSFVPGLYF